MAEVSDRPLAYVPPAEGTVGTVEKVVSEEITVRHFHPEMPAVLGTPFMIYLMEVAASSVLEPSLPAGWTSVGVAVDVQHLAATPIGCTVTARARVTAASGRLVTFAVEAHDGHEKIGEGRHIRAVVEQERFFARALAKRHG